MALSKLFVCLIHFFFYFAFSLSLSLSLSPPLTMLPSAITQALYVNPSDCYNIHWPVVRGQLNVHAGPGGSLTAVLADLETIWGHVIQKQLDIPLKDLKVGQISSSLCITFLLWDKLKKRKILIIILSKIRKKYRLKCARREEEHFTK